MLAGANNPTPQSLERTAYDTLVHRMDEMVGQMLDALQASGVLDETLVVYTSDHGDHVGERGLF